MQTGRFRVSLKKDSEQPNPFFAELVDEIYAALINNTEPSDKSTSFYTCKRLSVYSNEERDALLRRSPDDVRAVAGRGTSALIDAVELDLIDFLLHFKDNRILAIVGSV